MVERDKDDMLSKTKFNASVLASFSSFPFAATTHFLRSKDFYLREFKEYALLLVGQTELPSFAQYPAKVLSRTDLIKGHRYFKIMRAIQNDLNPQIVIETKSATQTIKLKNHLLNNKDLKKKILLYTLQSINSLVPIDIDKKREMIREIRKTSAESEIALSRLQKIVLSQIKKQDLKTELSLELLPRGFRIPFEMKSKNPENLLFINFNERDEKKISSFVKKLKVHTKIALGEIATVIRKTTKPKTQRLPIGIAFIFLGILFLLGIVIRR